MFCSHSLSPAAFFVVMNAAHHEHPPTAAAKMIEPEDEKDKLCQTNTELDDCNAETHGGQDVLQTMLCALQAARLDPGQSANNT
jgi:hypothetical protein